MKKIVKIKSMKIKIIILLKFWMINKIIKNDNLYVM